MTQSDDLHKAIAENKQISFSYMRWNLEKKMEPRKEKPYVVSPWALTWDDENYYMIAYDAEAGKIKHYRVDKMKGIRILNMRREGREEFRDFNIADYAKMSFGMFGGEKTKVKLEFDNIMVGVMIDRFGKDISIHPAKKKGWSEINVDVAMSDQFLGWIFALGGMVRIIGPKNVVKKFGEEIEKIRQYYEV